MKSHANLALNRLRVFCFSLVKMASFHSLCFFTSVLQSWNWSVCAHSAGENSISTLVYRYKAFWLNGFLWCILRPNRPKHFVNSWFIHIFLHKYIFKYKRLNYARLHINIFGIQLHFEWWIWNYFFGGGGISSLSGSLFCWWLIRFWFLCFGFGMSFVTARLLLLDGAGTFLDRCDEPLVYISDPIVPRWRCVKSVSQSETPNR